MKFESLAIFGQIKEALSRNKLKKIIALIMSMSLWVYVMGAQNPVIEDSYRVKVNLKGSTPNYKAFYDEHQNARILLSAPRSYFIDYSETDIRAYIDISQYGEGEFDIPIEASYPKGFELLRISPENVHVHIEPIIERQMDLDVTLSGSTKNNTVIRHMDAPKNVTVVGAKSAADKVTKVVGFVGIVDEDDDFELNVPVTAVDENGREVPNVRVVPAKVNVFLDVEKGAKKTVPIIASITAPEGREISKVTLSPENVEIEGVADVVNDIESLNTESIVLTSGSIYKNYVNLVIPNDIVKTEAERVFVTIELKPVTNNSNSSQ